MVTVLLCMRSLLYVMYSEKLESNYITKTWLVQQWKKHERCVEREREREQRGGGRGAAGVNGAPCHPLHQGEGAFTVAGQPCFNGVHHSDDRKLKKIIKRVKWADDFGLALSSPWVRPEDPKARDRWSASSSKGGGGTWKREGGKSWRSAVNGGKSAPYLDKISSGGASSSNAG